MGIETIYGGLLVSKHIVDSFVSVYTPGLLTNGITNTFSPATTFDTFYFKNPTPFLLLTYGVW